MTYQKKNLEASQGICYICSTPVPLPPCKEVTQLREIHWTRSLALSSRSSATLLLCVLEQFAPHLWSFQL